MPQWERKVVLICPHCNKSFLPEEWGNVDGTYTVSGEDGFSFGVLTCPDCGGIAPLVATIMVAADDPRLLEDSAEAADRLRQLDESPQGKYNPPPEVGAYEYYCPECERIWLDTEPLPSGLCCELHGFVSLRKRLRTVDQTKRLYPQGG